MAEKRLKSSRAVQISLAVIVFAVITSTLWVNFSYLTRLTLRLATTEASHCIVYDKPPRTGSTTIASALRPCMARKGYQSLPPGPPMTWYSYMQRFVDMDAPRRAAVSSHMHVTVSEMHQLPHSCPTLLYISSTRPVAERVLSAIKYETFSGHGSRNITSSVISKIVKRTPKDELQKREFSLEQYPYLRQQPVRFLPENKVFEHDRLQPDYVVRDTHFLHDFHALLDALRCPRPSKAYTNEHTIVQQGREGNNKSHPKSADRLLEKIKRVMILGDLRYNQLLKLAEHRNQRGLQLARQISAMDAAYAAA